MIDVPVPVYVEYKNLSPIVIQAERQKDAISTVLKRLEGNAKTIFELNTQSIEKDRGNGIRFYWQARCLVCFSSEAETQGVLMSSIRKSLHDNGIQSDIYFDTVDAVGKVSSWKVELLEVKPLLVRNGENVKVHFYTAHGIEIEGAGKSLKNGKKGDIIQIQVKNFFNRNERNNSTEIIEAKVTSQNEVEYVGK